MNIKIDLFVSLLLPYKPLEHVNLTFPNTRDAWLCLFLYLSYCFFLGEAKGNAPCVIFIDELDSVGGKRIESPMHPYSRQTINQLLAEMDG